MTYCTTCAVQVRDGWKFCAGCGDPTDHSINQDGHYCINCGVQGDAGWQYCGHCATPRKLAGARAIHCTGCGQAKSAEWGHCPSCGTAASSDERSGRHCTDCGRRTAHPWNHCETCGSSTALSGRPDGQYCNTCGIRTSNTWTCCAGCGHALLTPADARDAHDAHCVRCGVRGSDGWRHCPSCGQVRIASDTISQATGHFCIECGSRCDNQWSNCARCGHEVTPDEVVAPPSGSPDTPQRRDEAESVQLADVVDPPLARLEATEPPVEPLPEPPRSQVPMTTPADIDQPQITRRGDAIGAATQVVSLAAAFLGALCVLGLFRLNRELHLLGSNLATGLEGDPVPVDDAEQMLERVFQPLFLIAALGSLLVMAAWTRRRHEHALGYGVMEPTLSSNWVGLSFLIPFVNVVVPKRGMEETWRASTPGASSDPRWKGRTTPTWIPLWRLLAIVGVALILVGSTLDAGSIEKSIDANTWSAIGYAIITLSFLVAIIVVSSINHLQLQRDLEFEVGHAVEDHRELLATIGGASELH